MPARYRLVLSAEQVTELEDVVRHAPKPFQRERASGVLKVYHGQSIRQVARHGLLKPHSEHTVKRWITNYLEGSVAAFAIAPGRGRHRRFFPPQPAAGRGRG